MLRSDYADPSRKQKLAGDPLYNTPVPSTSSSASDEDTVSAWKSGFKNPLLSAKAPVPRSTESVPFSSSSAPVSPSSAPAVPRSPLPAGGSLMGKMTEEKKALRDAGGERERVSAVKPKETGES